MTSHSFRHFCKPPLAHTPPWLQMKDRVSSPLRPVKNLGDFSRALMTENSRTLLFLGVSCQDCLCSVRIVVYEMVNQHSAWDSAHHLPVGHHLPSHFPMGHHLPWLPWALHRAPSPRSSDLFSCLGSAGSPSAAQLQPWGCFNPSAPHSHCTASHRNGCRSAQLLLG